MKISLNWLKQYVNLENETPEQISDMLTMTGLEVESLEMYEQIKGSLQGLVIGEVLECKRHPNADTLSITKVDVGEQELASIVCGASNVAKDQKVVVAKVGTTIYPTSGVPFKIKKAKIRGEVSFGMICAEDEIGLGTEHDGIMELKTTLTNGTPAFDYFDLKNDYVFEIGLTPNRADGASHFGTARDLKALLGKDLIFPDTSSFKVDNSSYIVDVKVENTDACPRYSGVTISDITVQSSPHWLKNCLNAIGLSPINNIVDATNYILHGLGQPLHAFDADKLKDKKIIVKNLPQDTPFITLDKKEKKISEKDLMICDGANPICIAGVFGGIHLGVTENTQNIFLESAYFSPDAIRLSSMYHGLKTDAAFRFERGIDPNNCVNALKAAVLLIQEVAGGNVSSHIVDIYPEPINNFVFEVKYKNIDRLIGKKLERQQIKEILQGLEIAVNNDSETGFTVSVPPYRVDVKREADIIEEILRIYGFNNVELDEHLASDYLAEFPKLNQDKMRYELTQFIASKGGNEIITNSITKSNYAEKIPDLNTEKTVHILNYLSEDLSVMRQSLIFSGLEVISHNISRKQKDLKLFEFGKTYNKKENSFNEQTKLCFWVTGSKHEESWILPNEKVNFYSLSTLVNQTLKQLKVIDNESSTTQSEVFVYGLDYQIKNKTMASLGLLKPEFAKELGIKQDVFYAEIDWSLVMANIKPKNLYQQLSKFPEVRRDLSLVMDKSITFNQIKELALSREKHLLKKINVFDTYESDKLGENKKSYSVSFILQKQNQTLTDKVIDKSMKKLMLAFEKELNIIIKQ